MKASEQRVRVGVIILNVFFMVAMMT